MGYYDPPDDVWYRCPKCGCSQEDAEYDRARDSYACPDCGLEYSNDDAIRAHEDAAYDAVLARAGL
jgi:transposase-like protein